jgi:hypothetical protein
MKTKDILWQDLRKRLTDNKKIQLVLTNGDEVRIERDKKYTLSHRSKYYEDTTVYRNITLREIVEIILYEEEKE